MEINLQRKTDLAIRAIESLAAEGDRIAGSRLAAEVGATPQFLLHVMHPLKQSGWVDSTRGPNGGYRLEVEPTGISVLDVIEAVEGPVANDKCVLRGGPCPRSELCALHEPWSRARNALIAELATTPVGAADKEATS